MAAIARFNEVDPDRECLADYQQRLIEKYSQLQPTTADFSLPPHLTVNHPSLNKHYSGSGLSYMGGRWHTTVCLPHLRRGKTVYVSSLGEQIDLDTLYVPTGSTALGVYCHGVAGLESGDIITLFPKTTDAPAELALVTKCEFTRIGDSFNQEVKALPLSEAQSLGKKIEPAQIPLHKIAGIVIRMVEAQTD